MTNRDALVICAALLAAAHLILTLPKRQQEPQVTLTEDFIKFQGPCLQTNSSGQYILVPCGGTGGTP